MAIDETGLTKGLMRKLSAVPSINSVRRRNPGILGVPATALAGCTEGRPVDDEAR